VETCPSKNLAAVLRNGELGLGDIDVILGARSLSTQQDRCDGLDTRYHFDADDDETLARVWPRPQRLATRG